jgi:ubiquinone/menaquinone biosynthesis C-methylase UbiE
MKVDGAVSIKKRKFDDVSSLRMVQIPPPHTNLITSTIQILLGAHVTKGEYRNAERIRRSWDKHATTFDEWDETFSGAVQQHVDWELLKGYLPQDKDSKILDAAGGTGRITLPLAKMGYSVTLCDISPRMLDVARQKLLKEGVLGRVEITECDVRRLRFADETFDFVLCWGQSWMIEALRELVRVLKNGGRISMLVGNRCAAAIDMFAKKPSSALALLRSEESCIHYGKDKDVVVSVDEAREVFEEEGVRVFDVHARGMLKLLSIPEEVQHSHRWSGKFFRHTTEMLISLCRESSLKGLAGNLILYGERIGQA